MDGTFPLGKTGTELFLDQFADTADTFIGKMVGIIDFADAFCKVKPIRKRSDNIRNGDVAEINRQISTDNIGDFLLIGVRSIDFDDSDMVMIV